MPIARRYLHNDESEQNTPEHKKLAQHRAQHGSVAATSQHTRGAGAERAEPKDNDVRMHNGWELGREELIKRIKKEQRPQWLTNNEPLPQDSYANHPSSPSPTCPQLLPPPELSQSSKNNYDALLNHVEAASSIARPRSALHSGDFRDPSADFQTLGETKDILLPLSSHPRDQWPNKTPSVSWYNRQSQQVVEEAVPFQLNIPATPHSRNRAASYSAESSAFVFIPPTSPLAVHSNSADLSGQEDSLGRRSRSPEKSSRRRTFSPRAIRTPAQPASLANQFRWPVPGLRQEKTFPYQAHQPRRSLSSFHNISSPLGTQTPSARSRRPSISSDASPLQRAPMVGRYEESILRGRMSTVPSKPFDFVAQIGVMGKGKCRASLKCPPHITIPFPAVFYNYGNSRGSSIDGPSPYVGMVDIENYERGSDQSNLEIQSEHRWSIEADKDKEESKRSDLGDHLQSTRIRKRDLLCKKPPGSSYRIPQQGQIQVVIKNPNKTAVKLFLIPYDLTGMEPGQKTFIRQRSYSAGPIIEMPISSRKNLGTDRPEAAISNSDDPNDRPVLRYLIHLQICCTSKGRFYLYKSMRIVFANRVPDGKEKLRSETQLPEPRFSAYKPERRLLNASQRTPHTLPIDDIKDMPGLRPTGSASFGNALFSFDQTKHVPRGPAGPISGSLIRPTTPVSHNVESAPMARSTTISQSMDNDIVMQDSHGHFDSPTINYMGAMPTDCQDSNKRSPHQHLFERRDRETYSSSSNGSSNQSPQSEGLIAQQFRDWAEKRDN